MNPASDVSGFTSIDEQPDPEFFVDFIDHASRLPGVDEIEDLAVAQLRLGPGGTVLDVGCGTGDDTRRLAALVGQGGSAIGVDYSEAMIAAARQRTEGTGLPAAFQIGDAGALEFADGTFDAVRGERVLIHVPDAGRALAEMVRVTRPGGRVVVIDTDYDGLVMDVPDTDLTRRAVHGMCDAMANGNIGRQLPRRFRELGLRDIGFDSRFVTLTADFLPLVIPGSLAGAVAAGLLQQKEADAFWEAIEAAQQDGHVFAAFPFFLVSGTKP